MREGLELVLDKIENRIGKRDGFLVDDVLNYFLQDEGVIEMSMNELEFYARTGEYIDESGVFEYDCDRTPGTKFQGKYFIYDKSLLLSKEFLTRKYGEKYKNNCIECRNKSEYMEWVEAGGIVIATLDYKNILCIDISLPANWEELYIVGAFTCMRKLDKIEFPNEDARKEEREILLRYWDYRYEEKALELFGKQ